MSVVTVDSLVSARKRMMYTHYGEGSDYIENRRNGTTRVAAEMGDARDAFDFVFECEQAHLRHKSAKYEGYELMYSWSKDEMDSSNPGDIQRCMEYAYLASHEVQPTCKVWVTMHVDGAESKAQGELGPIHAHVTVMNHDFETGKCIQHGMTVPRIRAINDSLSHDYGFQSLKRPEKAEWVMVREDVEDPFSLAVGDAVLACRDNAETLEQFKDNLDAAGVTLQERLQKDKSTGEEYVGWTYKMFDVNSPNRKSGRRRRAQSLAQDLTKEGIETYFEKAPERRAELLRQQQEEARKAAEAAQRQAEAEQQQEAAQADEIETSESAQATVEDLHDLVERWALEDEYIEIGLSYEEAVKAVDEYFAINDQYPDGYMDDDDYDYVDEDEYEEYEDDSYEDEDYSDDDEVEEEEPEDSGLRIKLKHEPIRMPDFTKEVPPEKLKEVQEALMAQHQRELAAQRNAELQRRRSSVKTIPGLGGGKQHDRTFGD